MSNVTPETLTFHVHGMHCNACVLTIEDVLGELSYITHAKSSLKHRTVEVTGTFEDASPETIAERLSAVIAKNGYTLSLEKKTTERNWGDFKIAIPVALAFAMLYIALQKIGLIDVLGSGGVTYGTAFGVGVIASVSTCMAVVGGLVLSMSATFAKEGDTYKPQMLFHGGRLVAFFVLGGIIGAIGSAFTLTSNATFALSLFIGLVMLVLGINLLDVVHFTKRLQPRVPKFLARHALGVTKLNHMLTPMLVGVATFFLPCGFTQSMQLYTLGTGGFLEGGFTMLAFALGTFPVLALLSFSSLNIKGSAYAGAFFKSAGLVVILFALLNIINSLVVIGVIPPFLNF